MLILPVSLCYSHFCLCEIEISQSISRLSQCTDVLCLHQCSPCEVSGIAKIWLRAEFTLSFKDAVWEQISLNSWFIKCICWGKAFYWSKWSLGACACSMLGDTCNRKSPISQSTKGSYTWLLDWQSWSKWGIKQAK